MKRRTFLPVDTTCSWIHLEPILDELRGSIKRNQTSAVPTESQPQRSSAHPGALAVNQLLLIDARKTWVRVDTLWTRPAEIESLDHVAKGAWCGHGRYLPGALIFCKGACLLSR